MKCKCGKECILKDKMFHLRGRSFSGWVCECNALYENKEDSMFKLAKISDDNNKMTFGDPNDFNIGDPNDVAILINNDGPWIFEDGIIKHDALVSGDEQ